MKEIIMIELWLEPRGHAPSRLSVKKLRVSGKISFLTFTSHSQDHNTEVYALAASYGPFLCPHNVVYRS